MNKKESYKFYRGCHRFAGPVIRFFRPFTVLGGENMQSGAALVCSNHSAMIDPFIIALAFGIDTHVHVITKIELFKIPLISSLLWMLGMISVDRSINDISSIRNSLSYLKKGEKVVIFPEGTRVSSHDEASAKIGAIRIAEHSGVPIIPVFIPRRKPFFVKSQIVFGKPYHIQKQKVKRTADDYRVLTEELMDKIQALDGLERREKGEGRREKNVGRKGKNVGRST